VDCGFGLTYGVAAYVILPRTVRIGLKILQRKHVPPYTVTGDGLPGDPVNLVLTGTLEQLHAAFGLAGWSTADRLGSIVFAMLVNEIHANEVYRLAVVGFGHDCLTLNRISTNVVRLPIAKQMNSNITFAPYRETSVILV
jgi:hypothetical protein